MTKNVLQKTTIGCPSVGTGGTYVSTIQINGKSENVYRYEFKYEYSANAAAKTGVVTNCTVKDSDIAGAGLVWRNKGGYISGSKVEGCHKVGASGFAEYNESTSVSAPKTETVYQYWIGLSTWMEDRSSYSQASDELISKNSWKTSDTEGQVTYAVSAKIENCKVASCEWVDTDHPGIGENGFVGINRVNKEGSAGSTVSGGEAVLSNCDVADAGAAISGFAGENLNGASITNCQVYGSKAYGSSSMGSASISQSAGFIITNGAGSTIDSCSFTGQVQGLKIGGFVLTNQGTIKNSYANVRQGWNKNDNFAGAAGFVFDNAGQIEYCHSLGQFGGSQNSRNSKNGIAAGFVMNNKTGATISNSYTAMWELYEPKNNMDKYYLFAQTAGGTFTKCYAMKPSSGSWSSPATGISYVTGNELKTYTADLGTETKGQTIAYTAGIGDYPFPVSVNIKNYGDWYIQWKTTDWGNSGTQTSSTYSVSLSAGAGVFSEEAAASAKAAAAGDGSEANAISLAALDDADSSAANANAANSASGTSAAVSDLVLTLQPEESGEEETAKTELDLSEFKPTRKGWKLLGWLITSPSELADQTAKTTVSDIVTKISKVSDGTAAYELEKGAKSYHYAPEAVVTVTQDMTLAAVWVPDDDTIARTQDGTLRMDENGNILDAEEAAGDAASASSDATTEQSNDAADQKVTDSDASQTGQDTSKKTTDGKTTDASDSPAGQDSSKASNDETASAADGASEPAEQASEQEQGTSDTASAAAVKAALDTARETIPETSAAGTAEPANESSTETSEEQTE